jgi:2-polyprenyl-3-methyl-5-hydroxy-6-metoxy-1,4-benzoquinol methylase
MEDFGKGQAFTRTKKRLLRICQYWTSAVLPYRSMNGEKSVLEGEYSSGVWDYLRGLDELSRFSVVAGYCHYFKKKGAILEIGCGEGILQERLNPLEYSRYVGVDISAEAIKRAAHKQDERTSFVREDASIYAPETGFDVILFNECLEYFADPLRLVQRYESFLEKHGLYIVSMFVGRDTARANRIWKMLASRYTPEAQTRVSTKPGYTWIVKVFIPRLVHL